MSAAVSKRSRSTPYPHEELLELHQPGGLMSGRGDGQRITHGEQCVGFRDGLRIGHGLQSATPDGVEGAPRRLPGAEPSALRSVRTHVSQYNDATARVELNLRRAVAGNPGPLA